MAQRFVEDADDDVVGTDMRHVGGEADEDHDDHPQAAAAFFKKGVDAVADVGDRVAAWGLDDVVVEREGDDEQGDADGKEHAFGVVTLDDETASSDEGEDADEDTECGTVHEGIPVGLAENVS